MTDAKPAAHTSAPLLEAVLGLTAELELPALLRRFVDAARDLTGARFAAMNVFDSRGRPDMFVHSGIDGRSAELIGAVPHGLGVLGNIPAHGRSEERRVGKEGGRRRGGRKDEGSKDGG